MRQGISLALAILLAACGKERPGEPVATSDSSGVHIVTSRAAAWTAATEWKVGGKPTLQIGGGVTDTSALVGPVVGAFRAADGRVVVADQGTHSLRWFSADGKLLHVSGGEGEGPGEFRYIHKLLEIGDSIGVYDAMQQRLSIFDANGTFARMLTIAGGDELPLGLEPIGRLSTGQWIAKASTTYSMGTPSGPARDSVWIWSLKPDGTAGTKIAAMLGSDALIASSSQFLQVMPAPFGRTTTIRVHDGMLWVGTADSYRIDGLDLQGRVITSVRLDQRPAILEPERGKGAVDSLRKGTRTGPMAEMIGRAYDEALEKLALPEFEPPYSTFRIADDSTLWVEHFVTREHTGATKWDVFLPDGHWQGTITLPPGFTPTQISHAEILGIWKDPDGVDHVVAYPLERGMTS
jgi:hypothetical protein